MQDRTKNRALIAGSFIVMGACVLGMVLTCIGMLHPVSPYQPLSAIQSQYKSCKANSPPGFDCVMVPMMVSEQAMPELGAP